MSKHSYNIVDSSDKARHGLAIVGPDQTLSNGNSELIYRKEMQSCKGKVSVLILMNCSCHLKKKQVEGFAH